MRTVDWNEPKSVRWEATSGWLVVRVDGMETWADDVSEVLTSPIRSHRKPDGVEMDAIEVLLSLHEEGVNQKKLGALDAKDACWLQFEDGSQGALILSAKGLGVAVMAFGRGTGRDRSVLKVITRSAAGVRMATADESEIARMRMKARLANAAKKVGLAGASDEVLNGMTDQMLKDMPELMNLAGAEEGFGCALPNMKDDTDDLELLGMMGSLSSGVKVH